MAKVKSLPTKNKIGYCSGIIAESLLYNLFFTYYLVFLTDVVRLTPLLAGIVSFVSVFWDAVADPIIGALSDKDGADKRKFMFRAAFPMAILIVACFADPGLHSQTVKFIYYLAVTMLFWLAYTVYTIPYYAVVAEITPDYDERTDIRGLSALINAAGIFAGNALPAVLPAVILGLGFSAMTGWLGTVVIMSLLSVLFAVVAVLSLRHVTLRKAEAEAGGQRSVREIFGSFLEVLKIKPFKWFVLFVFAFLISSSMLQTNFVYLIKLVFALKTETEAKDKMVVIIVVLVGVIALLTPVVTKIAEIKDRRFAAILFFSISLAGLAAGRFLRLGAQATVIYVALFMAVGAACFWTVFYSMAYDLVEVDEFICGRRREGVITALPQFFQKFGSAVGMLLVSLVLNVSGYQADEVPPEFIINASTVIPAAFLGVSIFGAFMFPVTKERFHRLQEVLAKKNAGESYDTAGLEKLV